MKSAQVVSCAALVLGLALVSTPMAASANMAAKPKTITVKPGESIQAAVNAAAPGDTVKVQSGSYTEKGTTYCAPWVDGYPKCTTVRQAAVLITKRLTLTASGPVTISSLSSTKSQLDDGIVALGNTTKYVDGLVITGFTVDGFAHSGIVTGYVSNFDIENNVTSNMGEMGIWPTLSANGQVKKNVAYGTADSALWVEASQNVRVIDNELYNAPTGLEVTISKDITMANNNIHDNTVGVGLYHPAGAGLPSAYWPTFEFRDWHVVNNYIHENNYGNVAGGGLTGELPPGIGVVIAGASDTDVQENRIENHALFGVAMIDWCVSQNNPFCTAVPSTVVPPNGLPEVWQPNTPLQYRDPTVNDTRVVGNKFSGNGFYEPGLPVTPFIIPGSDIVYLGADAYDPVFGVNLQSGTDNCQGDNKFSSTLQNPVYSNPADALAKCKSDGHGNDGHGNDGHGNDGHGNDGHGTDDHHPH